MYLRAKSLRFQSFTMRWVCFVIHYFVNIPSTFFVNEQNNIYRFSVSFTYTQGPQQERVGGVTMLIYLYCKICEICLVYVNKIILKMNIPRMFVSIIFVCSASVFLILFRIALSWTLHWSYFPLSEKKNHKKYLILLNLLLFQSIFMMWELLIGIYLYFL